MRVFIDTNIWIYRIYQRDPLKSRQIRDWLSAITRNHEVVISTQVLIELRSVVTRKLKPPLAEAQITALLEALCEFELVITDGSLVVDAHLLAMREHLSWFDALIAEAAIRSHCNILYSEDFNHGGRIGDLKLINPLME